MRGSLWLIFLQALSGSAVPHHRQIKRDVCCPSSVHVVTETITLYKDASISVTTPVPTEEPTGEIKLVSSATSGSALEEASTISSQTSSSMSSNLPGGVFYASVTSLTVTPGISGITTVTSSGTGQILPTLTSTNPNTVGSVVTTLSTSGVVSSGPLLSTPFTQPTSIITATEPITTATSSVIPGMISENIFQPVETDAPPSVIGTRSDHPVPRLGVNSQISTIGTRSNHLVPRVGVESQTSPIGTNKFYANFFLGSQTAASWTHPYSVAWSKGSGSSSSWGMSIQHIDDNQKVFGPNATADPAQYFINPIGIQSLVLSASELGANTTLTTDSLTAFSANVNLLASPGAEPSIKFPLVQGMGFITGIFGGDTPIIQTGVFFRSITKAAKSPKVGITKYTILLEDGKTWLLYASSIDGLSLDFTVVNNGLAQASSNFNGIIQIAKLPAGGSESV